jgi:hypothetical protein
MEHRTGLALAGAVVAIGGSGAIAIGTFAGVIGPNPDDVPAATQPAAAHQSTTEPRRADSRKRRVQRVTRYVDVPMPAPNAAAPAAAPAAPVAAPAAAPAVAPPAAAPAPAPAPVAAAPPAGEAPATHSSASPVAADGEDEAAEDESEATEETREEAAERREDRIDERQDAREERLEAQEEAADD